MVKGRIVQFSVYDGPSLLAPFAAAIAELEVPARSVLAADRVRALVAEKVPERLAVLVALTTDPVSFVDLGAALAKALQDLKAVCDLPLHVQRMAGGRVSIALGFHDAQTALHALREGLEIANALLGWVGGGPDPRDKIAAAVDRVEQLMAVRQPDVVALALMRAARARDIPVYPLAPGSRVWLYGQGSAGIHFFEAANHHDSSTGAKLAGDKFMTNQLIRRLGLPGVEHEIAHDPESAGRIAERLGFPLVVKPRDRGKGHGVTAGIRTREAFDRAVSHAARAARRGGVLVERFVDGEDHRLSVFGGKLCFASRRSPPRIVGDGERTVAELIDRENAQRTDADVAAGFVKRLQVDGDLLATLAGQGLGLGDRPAPGRAIALRTIANVATGGTVTDCTAIIHPDNRALAETIARAFHMDALGIDFMTPDITRSWRETRCAILEINATPGFSSDARAELIIDTKFPGGGNGRIPAVVLIGADPAGMMALATRLRAASLRVGETDGRSTNLEGELRCAPTATLPERITALLLDPGCDALVIGVATDEIERHGFPLDHCDLAIVATRLELAEPMARLIRKCAREVIVCGAGESVAGLATSAAERLLAGRARAARAQDARAQDARAQDARAGDASA